jgi:hypothetical protein
MTNFNTQHDEFAGIDTDELFDNAIMFINEAQSLRHNHDVTSSITQASMLLDYLNTRISKES